jgi:asparagine synthase (glutamine-hydrolysing)
MFRYVALIWNTANQRQSEAAQLIGRRLQTAPQWQEVLDHGGMRVLCADVRAGSLEPHVFSNHSGVVLGQLFERNSDPEEAQPSRKALLDARQTANIVNSRGKRLVSNYWGNYVAFLHDPDAAKVWIVKDPAGSLPCYSTVFREVTIFFSCMADCVDLRLLHFTVNPSYLRDRVIHGNRSREQNALNEVTQLHRGECAEMEPRYHPGQFARHLYWNPLNFSESDDAIEDPERAARALRGTVRSCTHTLAGCHDSLLHRLSGGLDSSIVSGCLRDAPLKPRITSYTYYNPRACSDERPWAQLAALHAGCEHVERAMGARDIRLATMQRMRPSAEPASVLGYIHRSLLDGPLAAERKATAIFTGDGGDTGFCGNSTAHAATEYLRRHGLRPEAFRIAAQVALCTHRSTLTMFSRSLRRWLLGSATNYQAQGPAEGRQLVNPDVIETLTGSAHPRHPWSRSAHAFHASTWAPTSTSAGRKIMPSMPDYYDAACEPDSPMPQMIAPLYSQPAIELFLRIPLYVHFEGGRDRGLARRAFSDEVPKPILRRMRKERTPGLYDEVVRRNRDFLRQVFMEGVLIGEGLLSRRAIEAALSGTSCGNPLFPEEIFRHLDTEIWARHWTQQARPEPSSEPLGQTPEQTLRVPLLFLARGPQYR